MNLYIYELAGTIYEGESSLVNLPSEDGEITVLPNHAPLVSVLKSGIVRYKTPTKEKSLKIKKGAVMIDGKNVTVLADK